MNNEFEMYFPIYNQLTKIEQDLLKNNVTLRKFEKGSVIHNGSADCLGLLLVESGQLRAYMVSEDGREITLYRLFERDMCLFSASCMLSSIQFDITISVEKDTNLWLIPANVYKDIMEKSAKVANYTNELMASRFTDVMWLVEQIMWKSFDKRLAAFLLEECSIENSYVLKITHEKIAAHLGSAREVVTRMLKYFQTEGLVKLTRGTIEVVDYESLSQIDNP